MIHTVDTIETDPVIKERNLTRAQLIDYLLDVMLHGSDKEKTEAVEKLQVICPKRD